LLGIEKFAHQGGKMTRPDQMTGRPGVSGNGPVPTLAAPEPAVEVRLALRWSTVFLAVIGGSAALNPDRSITPFFFRMQDGPVIVMACVLFAALSFKAPAYRIRLIGPHRWQVWACAAALLLVVWAGTYWVMLDYPLARDTRMVDFDMAIFASGKLAQPLPQFWQPFAEALVPNFLLDVPGHALLVSTYLPGNALLRAAFQSVGLAQAMNPFFTALGFLALYDIARREFPQSTGAVWVALATYALSTQVLVMGMTSYAMTPQLALNLVWLCLFVRGKTWQHLLAMLLGFYITGLHQAVFHPLFVAPFLLTLLPQRRWALFGLYGAFYAACVLFWFSYPSLVVASAGAVAEQGSAAGVQHFVSDRIVPLFIHRAGGAALLMEYNILRFAAWMPLFTLPFTILAWKAIRANRSLARPAFGGIVLLLVAMFIILPEQGHGFGYRYLHGFIGNFAILAGYGFERWSGYARAQATGVFAVLAAATVVVVAPFLMWSTRSFIEPYAKISQLLERQKADFVVVDTDSGRMAVDQVANRADLKNRPLLFASNFLAVRQIDQLCSRGKVTFVGPSSFAGVVLLKPDKVQPNPHFAGLARQAAALNCRLPLN
jgi:hypothetical protein